MVKEGWETLAVLPVIEVENGTNPHFAQMAGRSVIAQVNPQIISGKNRNWAKAGKFTA